MALSKENAKTACLLDLTATPSKQRLSELHPELASKVAAALETQTKTIYTHLRRDNDPTLDSKSTPPGPQNR